MGDTLQLVQAASPAPADTLCCSWPPLIAAEVAQVATRFDRDPSSLLPGLLTEVG